MPTPEGTFVTIPQYFEVSRVVYGGAAYGGKSTLISCWLDGMCNTYEKTRYYLGRETLKDIKESVLLTFFDWIKQSESKVKYNEQKSKLTYYNGSEIYLLETFNYPADPNFDRFGSREYTAGAIEEGVTTVKRAADILLSRTRYKHQDFGLHPKQLITLNPGDGWIKEDIVIPTMEGLGPKRKSDIFVMATLESNPNKQAANAYKKNLEENLSSYDRERLLNGNWNAKPKHGAEFLKDFDPDKHTGTYEYDPRLPIHISFDENVNPHITCLIFQIKFNGGVKVTRQIGEICNRPPINTRRHVCQEIIKRYKGHIEGMFVYGDATSKKATTDREKGENFFTDILSYLKEFNPRLRVPSINPPVVSKGGFLNLIFEKDYRSIEFRIDKSCKVSINDYAYAVEDAEGGISKKKVTDPDTGISYEKWGHAIDSMSYFICETFLADFNYYLSGGSSPVYEVGNDRNFRFER
jgi:phage terminase large subunit